MVSIFGPCAPAPNEIKRPTKVQDKIIVYRMVQIKRFFGKLQGHMPFNKSKFEK